MWGEAGCAARAAVSALWIDRGLQSPGAINLRLSPAVVVFLIIIIKKKPLQRKKQKSILIVFPFSPHSLYSKGMQKKKKPKKEKEKFCKKKVKKKNKNESRSCVHHSRWGGGRGQCCAHLVLLLVLQDGLQEARRSWLEDFWSNMPAWITFWSTL